MRPFWPVPRNRDRSTPSSRAKRRTPGLACAAAKPASLTGPGVTDATAGDRIGTALGAGAAGAGAAAGATAAAFGAALAGAAAPASPSATVTTAKGVAVETHPPL